MHQILFGLAAVALLPVTANAATLITSSFGTVTGTDDDNQAGPVRGVEYKIITTGTYTNPTSGAATHALSATDSAATQVQFQNLQWQTSSSTTFGGAATTYLAIMDGFTVDSSGAVTTVGTLLGVSSNSIDGTTVGKNANLSWNFNNTLLTVGSSYQFVFVNTATPSVAADFIAPTGGLELKTGTGLLSETTLMAGNASSYNSRANWEPVFNMTYNAIPEPSAALLGSIGLLALLRRRRA